MCDIFDIAQVILLHIPFQMGEASLHHTWEAFWFITAHGFLYSSLTYFDWLMLISLTDFLLISLTDFSVVSLTDFVMLFVLMCYINIFFDQTWAWLKLSFETLKWLFYCCQASKTQNTKFSIMIMQYFWCQLCNYLGTEFSPYFLRFILYILND